MISSSSFPKLSASRPDVPPLGERSVQIPALPSAKHGRKCLEYGKEVCISTAPVSSASVRQRSWTSSFSQEPTMLRSRQSSLMLPLPMVNTCSPTISMKRRTASASIGLPVTGKMTASIRVNNSTVPSVRINGGRSKKIHLGRIPVLSRSASFHVFAMGTQTIG